jgi:hypothetical protein
MNYYYGTDAKSAKVIERDGLAAGTVVTRSVSAALRQAEHAQEVSGSRGVVLETDDADAPDGVLLEPAGARAIWPLAKLHAGELSDLAS